MRILSGLLLNASCTLTHWWPLTAGACQMCPPTPATLWALALTLLSPRNSLLPLLPPVSSHLVPPPPSCLRWKHELQNRPLLTPKGSLPYFFSIPSSSSSIDCIMICKSLFEFLLNCFQLLSYLFTYYLS